MAKTKKSGKYRDAATGRYTTKTEADKRPRETVREKTKKKK